MLDNEIEVDAWIDDWIPTLGLYTMGKHLEGSISKGRYCILYNVFIPKWSPISLSMERATDANKQSAGR